MPSRDYPRTAAEVLGRVKYRRGVIAAMESFRDDRPFRMSDAGRLGAFRRLAAQLARCYGIPAPDVHAAGIDGGSSGASSCLRLPGGRARITMRGRMSVITFLHEFAHALGRGERGACRWSLNLFRRIFPVSFARLRPAGHTMVRGS